ncbi:MAG: aconitase X catalytic domain-containing protein [Clostridium sp.]|nr:aconitase X catalytic domain-containing protein [Clostridium sp.]
MVRLKKCEQALLDGSEGGFRQKAMEMIVNYANVLGAKELCKVDRATVCIGAQHWQPELTKENYVAEFSRFMLNSHKALPIEPFCRDCITVSDSVPFDLFDNDATHMPRDKYELNKWILEYMRTFGVATVNTCTPYYSGWLPLQGEHFVTNESSNAVVCNSIMGACGNSDGVETAICAAITGYTPLWGMHCQENRYATDVFRICCPSGTAYDWDVIGYTAGRLLSPGGRPVLTGDYHRPNMTKLRQCFASLAVPSPAEICHITGLTPEARDLEDALRGHKPVAVTDLTRKEFDRSVELLSDPGGCDVELISIGCPHLSLEEVAYIASRLEGKKISDHVELWIWTDYSVQALAELNGYKKSIEGSGGRLLNSACPLVMRAQSHGHAGSILVNSAKQAHNLRNQTKAKIFFGNTDGCIDSAISGRWDA